MSEICPACSTPLVDSGPPINSEYCPNTACTHQVDEMAREVRESWAKYQAAEHLRKFAPDMLAALTEIAAFGDARGCEYLELYDSYAAFDEPASVQIARACLAGITPLPSGSIER